jgi:hypothetical protein
MYNFIFYFFYKYFQTTNDLTPRFRAILAVAISIGFHLFCLVSILKYLLNFTIVRFDERYLINKFYLMPFALLFILLVYLSFNKKRTDEIIKLEDDKGKNMLTLKYIVSIIMIISFPVILGIMFIKMGR